MNVLRILVIIAALFALKAIFFDRPGGGAVSGDKTLESAGLLPLDVDYVQGPAYVAGKPVLLEFWATWCGPCVHTIPHLNQLNTTFRSQGLQIVGISNEDVNVVRQFMTRHPMNYTVALDPSRKYFSALRIRGIPHAYLFDKNGKRVWNGHPQSLTPEIIAQVL